MSAYSRLLLSVAVFAMLPWEEAALAADNAATAEQPDDADTDQNEQENRRDIFVTGLREDEGQNHTVSNGALGAKTLLDTPFSITVVDRDDIAKRQATTIGQIFINDPAVYSFSTAGTTNWWGLQIRGLGVRNYYIDDVPLILYWGGDFPLESIETVEALKGLTGFMYGFGAPGGVISYRTKRPTAEPLLTTEVGYRTNSDFFGRIDAGGPLTQDGRLGYRLNVAGEKGTAYNDAGVNRWLGSLALEYAFSPSVKWYATGTYENSNLKHEPFQIYWDSYEDVELPKVTYDYEKLNVDNSYYKTRTLSTATGLDWAFSQNWSARLTYGYTSKLHHSNKMFINLLNQAGDYEGFAYNFAELDKSHFAQAVIRGDFETGPIRHSIVAGAALQITDQFFGNNDTYHWENDFNGNIYEDQTFLVTRDVRFDTSGAPYRERQRALFLSDTLYLGDHIQAIAGGRYTRYKLLDDDGDPLVESGYSTTAFTPTLALIYKPVPYVSLYGSYVESLEPGSRVGGEYENFGEILKATVSKQYEVGAKYEHQGLSVAAAGFRIERANTAERFIDGDRYLRQDGLTLYKGVEATANYRFGENLRLGVGAIHLDGKIRGVSDVEPGEPSTAGNTPMEAAKWQLTANAEYSVPQVRGLSVHGNVRYFDKSPTTDFNTLYMPSRTVANVGFQYATLVGGRSVTFTGNVNNLFNKKYWAQSNLGEGINGSLSVKVGW